MYYQPTEISSGGFFFVDKRFEISNQNLSRDITLTVELGEIVSSSE
jgi:hypothetical protein